MVSRAKPKHIVSIQALAQECGMSFSPSQINHRDVAIVALDGDKVIGFVWVGLMAKNSLGYIDCFAIAPAHRKLGLGPKVALAAFHELRKRGVERLIGCIRRDEFHDSSAKNALKMAIGGSLEPYTLVQGSMQRMEAELKYLGVL